MRRVTVTLAGIMLLAQGAARADTFLVTVSGTWDSQSPTVALIAPGAAFSFSYVETTPLTLIPNDENPQGDPTNFSYDLNGVPVAVTLASVAYPTAGNGSGLFASFSTPNSSFSDLFFATNTSQFYDGNLNLIPGVCGAAFLDTGIDLTHGGLQYDANGVGTVTITAAGVPEPASIALVGLGLVALPALLRTRRRRAAA